MADHSRGSSHPSRRSSGQRHGFRSEGRSWNRDQKREDERGGRPGQHGGQRSGRGDRAQRGEHSGRAERFERSDRPFRGEGGERSGREGRRFGGRDERKGGARRGAGRPGSQRRDARPPQRARVAEPPVPADVTAAQLEASARRELRGLGRANAENVARHLVMVQRLLETDPELAYRHARYASAHAGRIAVVREASAIAAYLAEHYQEALRDLRAARRLSGLDLHRAIEADCERALGNLGRALKAAEGADPHQLDDVEEAEIAMVVSGIRHEMGQSELGLIVIEEAIMMFRGDRETLRRLHSVRADRLEELGRVEEAQAVRERIGEGPEEEEDVEVFDIEEDFEAEAAADASAEVPAAESEGAAEGTSEATPAETEPEAETLAAASAMSAEDSAGEETEEEDESASWSPDFAARVEEELAEILGETEPGEDEAH